ncbi:hypothetical protein LZG72_17730 [Dyadobacter sp. CY323]|nr:hypothetical protein [Dyadobacter sp. CY323]MCE6990956.1 hypothetical protein [Dyadobacter sp. CY323]
MNTIPADIEVSISDNGLFTSNEFKHEFGDRKFHGTKNVIPIFENWRKAIDDLDTEWVCLASDDDVFYENAFPSFFSNIEKFPDAEIIVFGHNYIDENGVVAGEWKVPSLTEKRAPDGYQVFKYGVDARLISVFFKKSLYKKVGGLDNRFQVTAADSDFIQQALIHGRSLFVPEIVAGYRVWKKSFTNNFSATKEWMDEVILWQSKIRNELERLGFSANEINTNTSEVIALNLLSGLNTIQKQGKGIGNSLSFLKQYRFPVQATLKTQLKIIQCLLKTVLKS